VNADAFISGLGRAARARRALAAVGAPNALAARVADAAGFDALWVSGLEVSAAAGLPDENVLGSRDLAEVAGVLRRVSDLPVVVDIDNAGGSVAAAARLGGDLASAGVAAVCLEDSAYPKTNSFSTHRAQQLAAAGTVREQIKELTAYPVAVIARTETLICDGGLPEALERAEDYVRAGAHAVLVHSKDRTGEQALAVAGQWDGRAPLVSVPTAFEHLDRAALGAAGYALAIYANQLSRAAFTAMRQAAAGFQATGAFDTAALAGVQDLLQVADPGARLPVTPKTH
jgi:phosphoenolpyruvate phosphomutase